jgi:hypothetical protein
MRSVIFGKTVRILRSVLSFSHTSFNDLPKSNVASLKGLDAWRTVEAVGMNFETSANLPFLLCIIVNRTIQLWKQLPADALGTLSCKPSNFRKRVRKAINKAK